MPNNIKSLKSLKTGYYVPVLRDDEPPTESPTEKPQQDEIDRAENAFNFWMLALVAIAGLGIVLYVSGWLKPPQQATLDQLEQTQQQLIDTKTELHRITNCVNN
jgi:hypothetical protein